MASIIVEMKCPQHGFERFKIKVIKRFNIASDEIIPKISTKPKHGQISGVYIGRSVEYQEVRDYLIDYFDEKGMLKEVLHMKMLV